MQRSSRLPRGHSGSAAILLLALSCAGSAAGSAPARADAQDCAEELRAWERRAQSAGIDPGDTRPVPGFPGLATNRVLAAFAATDLSPAERSAWLSRLADEGLRRQQLQARALAARKTPAATVPPAGCLAAPNTPTTMDGVTLAALETAAEVRDDYLSWRRIFGLYPLTSLPVRGGIARLQTEIRGDFATAPGDLPVEGQLRTYRPAAAVGDVPPLPDAALDALGVRPARIPDRVLEALFARHAPVLEIDTGGSFDVPGRPYFAGPRRPTIDPETPTAYRYASVMSLGGQLRLQLNYVFWFAERPRSGAFDTLGGALDGIVWRVTLDQDGRVLLYDSIHPCGCYHMLFPDARLALRESALQRPEPPLVPRAAPVPAAGERVLLRIASRTHYLQGIRTTPVVAPQPGESYAMLPYDALYRVRAPGGTASLFGKHGLVPGTGRGERFYLWPMGIRSPGAMRERGRQATAFLGRRHFDDADLLETLFRTGF